jgi:hypothetical protein
MNELPKTISDVEKSLGIDFNAINEAIKSLPMPVPDQINLSNQYRWEKIVECINQGWQADWTDHDQLKYNPYAIMKKDTSEPSGLGFPSAIYDGWNTYTTVGPRLLFENANNALYAIRTFPEEYKAMMSFAKEVTHV